MLGEGGERGVRVGNERKEDSPLEFPDASRTDNDHGRLHEVNDVEQHVSCILGVPGLAGQRHV